MDEAASSSPPLGDAPRSMASASLSSQPASDANRKLIHEAPISRVRRLGMIAAIIGRHAADAEGAKACSVALM